MNCALVTGGSRGIGASVAKRLAAEHGLHILLNYNSNHEAAKAVISEIEAAGGTAEAIPFSVENNQAVNETLEKWFEANPEAKIQVLVNNAGITRDQLMVFLEEEAWDAVVNVSLKGFYNVTHRVMKHMLRNRYGRVINMVSLSGLKGVPGQTNYSAAKGGMIAATKALSQEVAKRNITVNAVAPGFIRSDMTKDLPEDQLKELVPMKRFGEPEEVSALVSFLARKEAGYITGEVININGGLYS